MLASQIDEVIEREREAFGDFGPFHRWWLHQNAPRSVHRWLAKERARQEKGLPPIIAMPSQSFLASPVGKPNTADFTARNNSTSELNIIGDSANGAAPQAMINQFCAIPVGDIDPGRQYIVKFGGIHSTTGTPTIIWTPRWGSSTTVATNVSLGVSQTFTTGSGVSAQPFFGEFIFTVRTAPPGATLGTGKGHGFVVMGTSTTAAASVTMGKTAATIDTTGQGTAGCGLTINITWGTASASNTITCENFIIYSS